MLGASTLAMALSGRGAVVDAAAFAARAGLHVVLNRPGTKQPLCILSDRKRKQADADAVEQAERDGRPRPHLARHACGIHHAIGADDAAALRPLIARLEKRYGERINVGIELGHSRVLVVDVDTADEDASFHRWLAEHGCLGVQMTVRSPGKRDAAGDMVHVEGGHYWFELPPDVELPTGPDTGVTKLGDGAGFTVMWANRQVLIPPSVRAEGTYTLTGAPIVAVPSQLLAAVREASDRRANVAAVRLASYEDYEPTSLDAWDARTPWGQLLGADGWIDTGLIDRSCGCPIWTAPGDHGSPKSATAHDAGCALFDTPDGWGPLHIWTDNPPEQLNGQRTITKLTYLQLMRGDANRSETLRAVGIVESGQKLPVLASELFADEHVDHVSAHSEPVTSMSAHESTPESDVFSDPGSTDDAEDDQQVDPLAIPQLTITDARARGVRPPMLVDGWLGHGGLARIIGKSNEGKTFVAVDLAACVATGTNWNGKTVEQGKVLYLNYEDNDGLLDRLMAWDTAHEGALSAVPDQFVVIPPTAELYLGELSDANKAKRGRFAQLIRDSGARLVVVDTQSLATTGVDENSAQDMTTQVITWLKAVVARLPDTLILLVHHRGHTGDHGRGTTALYAALDTEIAVERPDKEQPTIVVSATKQRAVAFPPPVTVTLATIDVDGLERTQAYIEHADPFDSPEVKQDREPMIVLDDNAGWPDVVRTAHEPLKGYNDSGGWTLTDLMNIVNGFGNLPITRKEGRRSPATVRRARVLTAVNRMVDSGELERVTQGSFRWP